MILNDLERVTCFGLGERGDENRGSSFMMLLEGDWRRGRTEGSPIMESWVGYDEMAKSELLG